MTQGTVIVFGSVNVDWVVSMPRLPSPGETVMAHRFDVRPGGKGANQALAARRAGARVVMAGAIGDDAFAATGTANLEVAGVDISYLVLVDRDLADAHTGVALIQTDPGGRNTIAVAAGANRYATSSVVGDDLLRPGVVVLLTLEVEVREVLSLARRAHARGATVVVNASPIESLDVELLECTDLLLLNEHEAAVLGQRRGDDDPLALCDEGFGARPGYVITRGAEGALYGHAGMRGAIPSPCVEVVDTVGAGDAFAGTLAAVLARGAAIDEAVDAAVLAGAEACTRAGAQAWP